VPQSSHKSRRKGRGLGPRSTSLAHLEAVLKHVETLYDAGRLDEVLQTLEANLARLGGYASLRAALAISYGELGRYREAAVQARLALEMDPRPPEYYLLAAMAYAAAGYYSYAQRARQQWLRFSPQGPMVAEMRRLDEVYRHGSELLWHRYHLRNAGVAEEAGYLLDEGRWALDQHRWNDALRYSQQAAKLIPGWPSPRNNISTALFYLRRYDDAIREAEGVLHECDPDNLHALANLVRYCLITGDLAAAGEYADRLASLPLPDDPTDAAKQIEGLSPLDRDAEIEKVAAGAQKEFGDLPPDIHVHWGIALANRNRRKEALQHLRRAEAAGEDTALLHATIEALVRGQPGPGIADRFPQTHFSDLMGREVLDEITKLIERGEKAGQQDKRAWTELLHKNPQLPLVCRRMLYEQPESAPVMIMLLAALPAPAAVEALREFATGRIGSQEDRMLALEALQDIGALASDAAVEMWIDGQQRTIRLTKQEISEEFVPDYPQKAADLYQEALAAHRNGLFDDAERLYEAMLKIAPNAKEAYNNLATMYYERGERERANALLDKALEIDPLYPFPVCARALQALARDDVEAAKAWLQPLQEVRQWHPLGFAFFQKTMARVAIAEKDYKAARNHLEMAEQLSEDPEISKMLASLTIMDGVSGFGDWWRERADAYRSRRQKAPLASDPTLEECFRLLTRGDMTGIRRSLGLGGASTLKKGELGAYLMDALRDEVFLAGVVGELNNAERVALEGLLDHGGVMDWQAFSTAHGDDLGESPYLEYHAEEMRTVMGRLRARGILFEGTAQDGLIVAVPRELRSPLREILKQTQPSPDSG
jgi:tetratricopeptide (TPR) repeat protein